MSKVLLVIGQDNIKELVVTTLDDERFSLLAATTVEDALSLLQTDHVDLIITEDPGQGIDAYRLYRELRSCIYYDSVGFLLLIPQNAPPPTFYSGAILPDQSLNRPFSPLELLEAIEKLLK